MAYITNSNAASIVQRTDITKVNITGHIYKLPIFFFSRFEANLLLVIKEFIKDPELFFKDLYVPLPAHKDTFFYIYDYDGKKPAYHKTTNCERLNSAFENFVIPKQIRDKGKGDVLEFRQWFKTVEDIFKTDKQAFVFRLFTKYGIQTNPEALGKDNSGHQYFTNLDLTNVEIKIDALIKEAGKYYYASEKNTIILKRFSDKTFLAYRTDPIENNNTGYTDEEVRAFLQEYDKTFKIPLKIMLREYYRVKYNPDLNFSGILLDNLGFKPCSSCYEDGKYTDDLEIPTEKHEIPAGN